MDDLTKITFNAVPRAVTALSLAANNAGLNRTDTLNRAIQVYSGLTRFGLWKAIRVLLAERATVRRFSKQATK